MASTSTYTHMYAHTCAYRYKMCTYVYYIYTMHTHLLHIHHAHTYLHNSFKILHSCRDDSAVKNTGTLLEDHFLNMPTTPVAQTLRSTINKWDLLKPRRFCKAKSTISKTKQKPTEWEKIFTSSTLTEG